MQTKTILKIGLIGLMLVTVSSCVPLSINPGNQNPAPEDTSEPNLPTSTDLPLIESAPPTSTAANTPEPAATQSPDTPAGSMLEVGEEWIQNGMSMRLKNSTFVATCGGFLEFELTIQNNLPQELVVNLNGNDFYLQDNAGQVYSNNDIWWDYGANDSDCHPYQLSDFEYLTFAPGGRLDLALRVLGELPLSATELNFGAYRAGRIDNAVWVIRIPR